MDTPTTKTCLHCGENLRFLSGTVSFAEAAPDLRGVVHVDHYSCSNCLHDFKVTEVDLPVT